jgi:hypothetical protein
MPANLVCATTWLTPDTVDAASQLDVWFQAQLTNVGDAPGYTSNLYYTAIDASLNAFGPYPFGSDTIDVGETTQLGTRIDGSVLTGAQSPVSIQLCDQTGAEIGNATLTINQ